MFPRNASHHHKHACHRKRVWLCGLAWIVCGSGCSGTAEEVALGIGGNDEGTLVIRAHGGVEAQEGIDSSVFSDGYAVRFDSVLLSITAFSLGHSEGGRNDGNTADLDVSPTVVELVPMPADLFRFEGLAARRWDLLGWRIAPPPEDAVVHSSAEAEAVEQMQQNRWSSLMRGQLIAPSGERYEFSVGFPLTIDYLDCVSGTDGGSGIVVPRNGVAEGEITWHLTHAFFDSFAEESKLRAESWVASANDQSFIDNAALATQQLANLRDRDDGLLLDPTTKLPVVYITAGDEAISTLEEFVTRARFGHFNGLDGFCQTEVSE